MLSLYLSLKNVPLNWLLLSLNSTLASCFPDCWKSPSVDKIFKNFISLDDLKLFSNSQKQVLMSTLHLCVSDVGIELDN